MWARAFTVVCEVKGSYSKVNRLASQITSAGSGHRGCLQLSGPAMMRAGGHWSSV